MDDDTKKTINAQPEFTACLNCGTANHTDYACPCACHTKKTKATLDLLVAGISADQAYRNHAAAQANLTAAFNSLQRARQTYLDAHGAQHSCEMAAKAARKAYADAKRAYEVVHGR